MLFHTPQFAIFFALLLTTFGVVRSSTARKLILLGGSYIFYMWWNPIYVLPLLCTTVMDYTVARMLDVEQRSSQRRGLLAFSIAANLGLLAYFKYYNFFARNLVALAQASGIHLSLPIAEVILPIGISFYTFHTMSYTIDVYRREIPVERSFRDFALFITFFPVLVAGPILRAKNFPPQLKPPIRLHFTPQILMLIVRGMSKKLLVADNVAPFVETIFSNPAQWPSVAIWMAAIAFSVQIYCDFSGYSDIARGLAMVFGLTADRS
jgi:alginate O-acetyltransferase complex protein AlgI